MSFLKNEATDLIEKKDRVVGKSGTKPPGKGSRQYAEGSRQKRGRTAVGKREILKSTDLEINGGEVHAIMGPNGSGKRPGKKPAGSNTPSTIQGENLRALIARSIIYLEEWGYFFRLIGQEQGQIVAGRKSTVER